MLKPVLLLCAYVLAVLLAEKDGRAWGETKAPAVDAESTTADKTDRRDGIVVTPTPETYDEKKVESCVNPLQVHLRRDKQMLMIMCFPFFRSKNASYIC